MIENENIKDDKVCNFLKEKNVLAELVHKI